MTAIEFDNVGKQYRLGLVSTQTLSHDLNRWWTVNVLRKEDPYLRIGETNDRSVKGSSDYVWALKDINFKVEQGDVVGIIGRNGAGKSTLLKLLSRVTGPTTGHIRARGRIGSLLEVGTGFHPEMTGRENIFMNGTILGMTKREVASKLDEIVDFSGCERYLDTPVKRYSSGMMVRLGFAVAAHLDPEILVVDEVLAVGDAEFQKKAIGKMKDVSQGEGRTVLFVSHNMQSMKTLCTHGMVLNNGQIVKTGTIQECIEHYIDTSAGVGLVSKVEDVSMFRENFGLLLHGIDFVSVEMLNPNVGELATDDTLKFKARMRSNEKYSRFQLCVFFINTSDVRICFSMTETLIIPEGRNEFDVEISIKNHNLPRGRYMVRFEANDQDFASGGIHFDFIRNVLSFEIKYIHASEKKEYLFWDASFGETLALGGDNVKAKIL